MLMLPISKRYRRFACCREMTYFATLRRVSRRRCSYPIARWKAKSVFAGASADGRFARHVAEHVFIGMVGTALLRFICAFTSARLPNRRANAQRVARGREGAGKLWRALCCPGISHWRRDWLYRRRLVV